jgi:hypothetical protein
VPDADDFRALARSSPGRWTTLRFTERRRHGTVWDEPVRAWLRRPAGTGGGGRAHRPVRAAARLLPAAAQPADRPPRVGPGSFPDAVYPTAHLVRLDAATGVCVWAEVGS